MNEIIEIDDCCRVDSVSLEVFKGRTDDEHLA